MFRAGDYTGSWENILGKHSLWYLPNRIDNEIKQIDQNIEIQKGFIEPYEIFRQNNKIIHQFSI